MFLRILIPSCVLLAVPAAGAGQMLEATKFPGTLIGLQYETFFTPHNVGSWETAEAIPILGKYDSYNVEVMRKHAEWFADLGIDWLLIDWSNMLWTKPVWEEHKDATGEIEQTTALLFKTYSQLEKEGKRVPKLVIMLGLLNGPPVPNGMQRLNGIIDWVNRNFLAKPEYRNLWLYYGGKPLMTILYNASCEQLQKDNPSRLKAPQWTVRWMASQLQFLHSERCGMWSWMDNPVRQVVTWRDGKAEETLVTPASFPMPGGWLHPTAVGRDHGAPYIESWKVAFESRPKFIQIHQWNEFAGQKKGEGYGPKHDVYGDEYDQEFSDDIEPTSLDACAYRGCGGWGYYYVNLTKALISLYRKATPDITVMALSAPFQKQTVKENRLPLKWEFLGKAPGSYTLQVDGKTVASKIQGAAYTLNLAGLGKGEHSVTLIANGAHTYFDLNPAQMTRRSSQPLPVTSTIRFTYAGGR